MQPKEGTGKGFPPPYSYRGSQHLKKITTVLFPYKCTKVHGMVSTWLTQTSRHCFLAGCGGTLYGDRGSVTSPGYPGTYPNNTHCEWALIAPAGRPVTVSFPFISIDDPGDCVQNSLLLYDGPDANSPSSGPYCGAVSTTNILTFPFIIFK